MWALITYNFNNQAHNIVISLVGNSTITLYKTNMTDKLGFEETKQI